jgi:hypothetical protein
MLHRVQLHEGKAAWRRLLGTVCTYRHTRSHAPCG